MERNLIIHQRKNPPLKRRSHLLIKRKHTTDERNVNQEKNRNKKSLPE